MTGVELGSGTGAGTVMSGVALSGAGSRRPTAPACRSRCWWTPSRRAARRAAIGIGLDLFRGHLVGRRHVGRPLLQHLRVLRQRSVPRPAARIVDRTSTRFMDRSPKATGDPEAGSGKAIPRPSPARLPFAGRAGAISS